MEERIAHCGLDCAKCEAYIATQNDDEELKEQVAALWTVIYKTKVTASMIHCDGCRADGRKTPYCAAFCPIRKCARQKGVETCGHCQAFLFCKTVAEVTDSNPLAYENLRKIRRKGK